MAKSRPRKKEDPAVKDRLLISQAIKKVQKGLQWVVKTEKGTDRCQIDSDPVDKVHHIKLGKGDPTQGLDLLHELCHASLGEKIHLGFATKIYAAGTEKQQVLEAAAALNVGSDWFIEELEYTLVPEQFLKEVKYFADNLPQFRRRMPRQSIADFLDDAFSMAQAERYLHQSMPVDGAIANMVRALLETDPSQPSIESLVALSNRLLQAQGELIGRILQVEVVLDGQMYAWKFLP
jgi:hypothetical protein